MNGATGWPDDPRRWPPRLLAKLRPTPHGCVYFIGALSKGYGNFTITRGGVSTNVAVHRFVYATVHGPFAENEECLHRCNEPLCVAVDGLVPADFMRQWGVPEELIPTSHLGKGSHKANLGQMAAERRSAGRFHDGLADARGDEGRSAAIKAALLDGFDAERLAAAMREGESRPRVRAALETYDPTAYLQAVASYQPWEQPALFG